MNEDDLLLHASIISHCCTSVLSVEVHGSPMSMLHSVVSQILEQLIIMIHCEGTYFDRPTCVGSLILSTYC